MEPTTAWTAVSSTGFRYDGVSLYRNSKIDGRRGIAIYRFVRYNEVSTGIRYIGVSYMASAVIRQHIDDNISIIECPLTMETSIPDFSFSINTDEQGRFKVKLPMTNYACFEHK